MSIVGSAPADPATPANGFYSPSDLRDAYRLVAAAARGGRGETVAIVDAFSDPRAATDLARYRAKYHLGACTLRSHCLRIINQSGQAGPLPRPDWDWAAEESIDLDMVSAICPRCHLVLVEAQDTSFIDLGTAEDTAVATGAGFVSNSWSGGEFAGQDSYDHYFDHPGVVIDFASGDFGYGTAFPADLQYVTSIGGTSLRHAAGRRGWTESVWGSRGFGAQGTGSGCSPLAAKPSWQRADVTAPDGCLNRTENDVAAVGNPVTGVAVFDSYPSPQWAPGWLQFGGTSVATPIITAIYALAGRPEPGTYPAEYPYLHPSDLFPVASGVNGSCERDRRYLCQGGDGYNGPTGLGTPDGTAAFTAGTSDRVTVLDPGTADRAAGSAIALRVAGLESGRGGAALRWTAIGLPAGLSIRAVPHTTDALITGTLPAAPASRRVTVRATDGTATGTTHFSIVTVTSLRAASQPAGRFVLPARNLCVDGGTGVAGQPVRVERCDGSGGQTWAYRPSGRPGAAGTLTTSGRCLVIKRGAAVLARCASSPAGQFTYLGLGTLRNAATGDCLAVPTLTSGTQLAVASCDYAKQRKFQSWHLPPGPIVSGARARCLDDLGASASLGAQAEVTACDGTPAQRWSLTSTGTVRGQNGYCLDGSGSTVANSSTILDGTPVVLNFCTGSDVHQDWLPGPGGELINRWSGKCLANQPGTGHGTGLVEEDCYGTPAEIWSAS